MDVNLAVQTRRHQIKDIDSLGARQVFEMAFLTLEPSERSQRQAFNALMPEIYMLRNKGFSFQQIATLMEQVGFRLQPSTVRSYFNELLVGRQDECIKRMNQQMMMLAEINKETKGSEISMIAAKAATIIEKQRNTISSRVDEVFGDQSPKAIQIAQPVKPVVVAPPAAPKNLAALNAAKTAPTGSDNMDTHGFGLAVAINTDLQVARKAPKTGNAFFDVPEDPVVPNLDEISNDNIKNNAENTVVKKENFRCLPLQAGIKPLTQRADVPKTAYLEGLLEHPAIPRLMLSLDDRLYGALLEMNENGTVRIESVQEKAFRVKWTKPIPRTETATASDFVKMDNELFKNVRKEN